MKELFVKGTLFLILISVSLLFIACGGGSGGGDSAPSAPPAPPPSASWTKQWGSAADEDARGIISDSSGNIYVTGATKGNIDGQVNAGDTDAYLTKYDSSGTRQWTRYIGTSGTDWGQAVDVDSAGNIYVTGSVSGSFDSKTYNGGKDVFLAKYNPSGTRLWYQQWGTSTDNFGYGVKVDGTVVYVTGYTNEDLPGESSGNSIPNIFLSKRNASDGNKIWEELDGTPNHVDYAVGIALDSNGNIYLTGYTTGDFGSTNNGAHDVFLVKYNASGIQQWVKQWGSTTEDSSYGVAVDSADNIYVTGSTAGSFGGQTGSGGEDIFLTKFNPAGTEQWTRFFGTSDLDRAYGISVDSGNNLYLTGATLGTLGGNTNQGQGDIFLMKCDADGNALWTKLLGTSAVDVGTGVTFSVNDGHVYVAGYTKGSLDGNINAGGFDIFLLKYDSSGAKQ
jgi:hypothetical protein